MNWLNLKRLLPPTKIMWRVLKNKLNRSKPNKNRSYKTSKKLGWSSLSIQPKKFKTKPRHKKRHKRPLPLFVDQLSEEPVSVAKEYVHPPVEGRTIKEKSSKEDMSLSDDGNEITSAADDMWESMVLASPLMDGINERADEFIARFRAEMKDQEMQASRL